MISMSEVIIRKPGLELHGIVGAEKIHFMRVDITLSPLLTSIKTPILNGVSHTI